MDWLQIPVKFGVSRERAHDVQGLSSSGVIAYREEMDWMRKRWGAFLERESTEVIQRGFYVYSGGFKGEEGPCVGGRSRGGKGFQEKGADDD